MEIGKEETMETLACARPECGWTGPQTNPPRTLCPVCHGSSLIKETPQIPVKVVNGIPKIYFFEKHYIILLFEEEIQEQESALVNYLKDEKWSSDPLTRRTVPVLKMYLNDLKTVLERFKSMEEV